MAAIHNGISGILPAARAKARLRRGFFGARPDAGAAPYLQWVGAERHLLRPEPRAFFETARKARAMVKIPQDDLAPAQEIAAATAEIADAFVKANPGLTPASIAIAWHAKRLTDVRICMGKDPKFQDCAEVEQHSCRRAQVVMPPPAHSERKAADAAR
jgi:ribonuclease T2